MLSFLLDLIIPPRATERVVRTLSFSELQSLQTEDRLPYHDPRVTALVWEIKYHADKRAASLAGTLLAQELIGIASEEIGKPLLIPIPMHPTRRRERGHNQTELLCEMALAHVPQSFEYSPTALVRTKNTPIQQSLPRQTRLANVKNSMKATPQVVGRVCIVVDDVTTTGATFAEATRALKKSGARRVHCVVLARS